MTDFGTQPPQCPPIDRFREEYGKHLLVVRLDVWPKNIIARNVARILLWGATTRLCEKKVVRLRTTYPEGNGIGLMILARTLELALETNGQECLTAMWYGKLNRGDIVLPVKSDVLALEVVQPELQRLTLSHFTSYGTFDFDAHQWRELFPNSGRQFEAPREHL